MSIAAMEAYSKMDARGLPIHYKVVGIQNEEATMHPTDEGCIIKMAKLVWREDGITRCGLFSYDSNTGWIYEGDTYE